MFESITFQNFKALRDTVLPLGRFTLLVGANGSGKSSVLQALDILRTRDIPDPKDIVTVGQGGDIVGITVRFSSEQFVTLRIRPDHNYDWDQSGLNVSDPFEFFSDTKIFRLDPARISEPWSISNTAEMSITGEGLAAVLDILRNKYEDQFDALEEEISRALPEFDSIKFDTTESGQRSFSLRLRNSRHKISAQALSEGTLLLVALLTLAHLPNPPKLVGIEEPDRAVHPRLLRIVQDALYRLAYPEQMGEDREPIQVIATTHSPYFLNLFKDHPEEIVIAEKQGVEAKFIPLKDRADIDDVLSDAPLGDVWYTGVLGGVPTHL